MALKTQGAHIRVSTAEGSAITITAITKADPASVTATGHGLVDGDIIRIDGVVGMIQVNGRTFVVDQQDTNTFTLKGVDSIDYDTYVSGGSAFKQTMQEVGQVEDISGVDGVAGEEDVTHLRSTAMEFLQTLEDFGNLNLALLVISDSGQTRLRKLKETQATASFAFHLSDATVMGLRAFVKSFTVANPKNSAVRGNVQLRITGKPAWFA